MANFQLPMMATFNFEVGQSSVATEWEKWMEGLVMYLMAGGITDVNQKKATLLYCAGERVREIFNSLPVLTKLEDEDDYQLAVRMLEGYFHPKKNVVFERHKFFIETMHATETTASYIVRLRKLAKTCQFEQYNAEQAIRDQAVRNCQDKRLRTR